MGSLGKWFTLILISILLLVFVVANSTQLVEGQSIVNITSPIQNQTYYTSSVLLNFTFETNLASNSRTIVFVYALDGQLGYHTPEGTRIERIGQFYPPFNSYYNTTIDNIPNGNHLLWVQVALYGSSGEYPAESLSQIVSFTVDNTRLPPTPTQTPTPSPSPSPTPSVPEFSYLTILPILLAVPIALLIVRKRLQRNV
jgi:hypothetical protein